MDKEYCKGCGDLHIVNGRGYCQECHDGIMEDIADGKREDRLIEENNN